MELIGEELQCFTVLQTNDQDEVQIEERAGQSQLISFTLEDQNEQYQKDTEIFIIDNNKIVEKDSEIVDNMSDTDELDEQQVILDSPDFQLYQLYQQEDGQLFIGVEAPTVEPPLQASETESTNLMQESKKGSSILIQRPITMPYIQKINSSKTADEPLKFIILSEDNDMLIEVNSEEPGNTIGTKGTLAKEFKCLYTGCHESFTSFQESTAHMKVHSVETKPYQCTFDGCDKRFATNYSRKTHLRTHTGEKPFICNECDKGFKTSGDLRKHSRMHTGEKPFPCPLPGCGRYFRTSNIRKVHMRSHTGERPYVCDYPNCGKAFSSSTNFKNHSRIHSGEKPFQCKFEGCTKRFTEYSSLHKHSIVHQVERPFECSYDKCKQNFKSESALNLHKRVKHNIVIAPDGLEIVVNIE